MTTAAPPVLFLQLLIILPRRRGALASHCYTNAGYTNINNPTTFAVPTPPRAHGHPMGGPAITGPTQPPPFDICNPPLRPPRLC